MLGHCNSPLHYPSDSGAVILMLFNDINITQAFAFVMDCLAEFIGWAQTTSITIGISVTVFKLATGTLVLDTIIREFVPWGDEGGKFRLVGGLKL